MTDPAPASPRARPWLPVLALGVVLGATCDDPWGRATGLGGGALFWWWILGLPLASVAVLLDRRAPFAARLLLFAAAGLLGAAMAGPVVPSGVPPQRLLAVEGTATAGSRSAYGTRCSLAPDLLLGSGSWLPERLRVESEAVVPVRPGDRMRARGLWTRDVWGDRLDQAELMVLQRREDGPRAWAWRAIDQVAEHRELAGSLVLGWGPAPEKADFRRAGLLHLLAVSGAHLCIAAALAAWLLRQAGMGWWGRTITLAVLVSAYTWLTGASPAAERACAMALALTLYDLLAREPHPLGPVSLAALALLVLDPGCAREIGFQLSLAAILGIATLGAGLMRLRFRLLPLEPWPLDRGSWRALLWSLRSLLDGLAIGIGASLAVAPLVGWYFGAFHPWSPATTLIASPPTAAALWLGLPTLVLGGCWPAGPWEGLYTALEASLSTLVTVVRLAADLPGTQLAWGVPPWWVMGAWPLLFLTPPGLRPGWLWAGRAGLFLLLLGAWARG